MNQRLEQFLAAENITQAQFADTIGVARASISHILAGRNKPGYDFIVNTALHYPSLSLDWLLCGKGKMYRGDIVPLEAPAASSHDLFGEDLPLFGEDEEENKPEIPKENLPINKDNNSSISKILVFYNDGTFEEFIPR